MCPVGPFLFPKNEINKEKENKIRETMFAVEILELLNEY